MSKFEWAGILPFVSVFVSHDVELGRNVSCDESTVSPIRGHFLYIVPKVVVYERMMPVDDN